jgi:ATP/maltotriose-dependent transcriptional regulator MalT
MERRDEKFSFWRTDAAMQLLSQWKASNIPKGASAWISMDAESQGYSVEARELLAEISAGERVCEALSMLKSADNDREWRDDMQRLNQELKKYWQDHEIATFPPTVKS